MAWGGVGCGGAAERAGPRVLPHPDTSESSYTLSSTIILTLFHNFKPPESIFITLMNDYCIIINCVLVHKGCQRRQNKYQVKLVII